MSTREQRAYRLRPAITCTVCLEGRGVAGWPKTRVQLQLEAIKAGWRCTEFGWLCPGCFDRTCR